MLYQLLLASRILIRNLLSFKLLFFYIYIQFSSYYQHFFPLLLVFRHLIMMCIVIDFHGFIQFEVGPSFTFGMLALIIFLKVSFTLFSSPLGILIIWLLDLLLFSLWFLRSLHFFFYLFFIPCLNGQMLLLRH